MPRRTRRLALLAAATGAAVLAPAAASSAEVYCVNTPSCALGIVMPDIQAALTAAQSDGNGADTVRIGPKATPYAGPFTYDDGGGGGKLTIVGAGIGETVLSSSGSGGHTLSLANADSVVKDLTLRTASSGQFAALWLAGGSAEGVRVEQAGSDFSTPGVNLYGAGSTFADGEIAMTAGEAIVTGNPNGATGLRVDRSAITGRGGATADKGSSLTVDRSTIDTTRGALAAAGNGSSLTVTNSAIRMGNASAGDTALRASGNATLTATHVTLLGSSSGIGVGASSTANGSNATTQVRNAIISGFVRHSACSGDNGGTSILTLQYTAANGSALTSDPDCTFTSGAGVQMGVVPQFAGGAPGADLAAADLRLRAPSPLIDAGDTSGVLATDLAGLSRPVDGDGSSGARVDLGALEYRRQAPVPAISVPATATTGQLVTVSAAGTTDPDGDTLTYAWSFGDGTTGSGPQAQRAYAAPGPKTVTLTVTDAAGRTATASATVQVTAPPATPATPGAEPPATPESPTVPADPSVPGGGTGTAPARDRTAPALGTLRIAKRARLDAGRSALRSRGADLRVTLGERATLTVTLRGAGRTRTLRFAGVRPGTVAIALGRRSGLRAGRYAVTVVARDAAGNRSATRRGTLRVR